MRFSTEDRKRLTSIVEVQEVLKSRGWNPYEYLMGDHQRDLWSPMGSYVASRTGEAFQLDIVDRASVQPRGLFPDEISLVKHYLETVDLNPPMTAEQQTRVTEAGRRDRDEHAEFRAQYLADLEECLGLADEPS